MPPSPVPPLALLQSLPLLLCREGEEEEEEEEEDASLAMLPEVAAAATAISSSSIAPLLLIGIFRSGMEAEASDEALFPLPLVFGLPLLIPLAA